MAPLLLWLELQCIILSPIPEGKKREPKLGDISTIKLPKLYITMKQIINTKLGFCEIRIRAGFTSGHKVPAESSGEISFSCSHKED